MYFRDFFPPNKTPKYIPDNSSSIEMLRISEYWKTLPIRQKEWDSKHSDGKRCPNCGFSCFRPG